MLEATYRVEMTLKLTEEGKSNGFGKWLLATISDELGQSEDILEWNFTKVEDTITLARKIDHHLNQSSTTKLSQLRASAESTPDA